MQRRQFLAAGFAATALPLTLHPANARAAVIDKPARFVVGFTPGGGTDTIARMVADAMRADYPAGLIVDNKPGAATRLATDTVKAAEPDGATLLMAPDFSLTLYPHSFRKLSYDPFRDFVPVASVAATGIALCVGPAVPSTVRTPADFLEWCKANPKKAAFGSPGAGSTLHFAGLMLAKARNVDITHVPYKGGAPALQDVVGGQIPANVCSVGEALPFAKGGRLRILGTFGTERDPFAPEAPTMVESGFKDVVAQGWIGVVAPARTPADVVHKTMLALNRATSGNALTAQLATYGMRPLTMTSSQFGAMIRADYDRWGPVVKSSGFSAED